MRCFLILCFFSCYSNKTKEGITVTVDQYVYGKNIEKFNSILSVKNFYPNDKYYIFNVNNNTEDSIYVSSKNLLLNINNIILEDKDHVESSRDIRSYFGWNKCTIIPPFSKYKFINGFYSSKEEKFIKFELQYSTNGCFESSNWDIVKGVIDIESTTEIR